MSVKTSLFSAVAACALAACSVQGSGDEAESVSAPQSELRSVMNMVHLMDHMISPAAYQVWDASGIINDESGEHEIRPQTDEEWETVANGGAMLAESLNLFMVPDRVLDDAWGMYAQELSDAGMEAFIAAEARDPTNSLFEIGARIDEVCTQCHVNYGIE